jgi:hypothetical protein
MPTQRGKYRCLVKEGTSTPFFTFEPLGEGLREIEGKVLSIELQPGTTFEQAQALARELDRRMVGLALTW